MRQQSQGRQLSRLREKPNRWLVGLRALSTNSRRFPLHRPTWTTSDQVLRSISIAARSGILTIYFVCLWTSHELHRGTPQAGQDSTSRVIPLALHWHWVSSARWRVSFRLFGHQHKSRPTPPLSFSCWMATACK